MKDLNDILWLDNPKARNNSGKKSATNFISENVVEEARNFHKSFPQYTVTPLQTLENLAQKLNVSKVWVKDESFRFGLNAFKVLGGAYAIGKYLSDKIGINLSQVSFDILKSQDFKEKIGDITFITATDGNHGRGVAWAAKQLGQKAVVYMPKGSAQSRLENIRAEGAEASIQDMNYDDAVRLANKHAEEYGWVIVQDTAWEGYEDIPTWIMQGYGTIIAEAIEQINAQGIDKPTHVFLQAGVGSFAGSLLGYLVSRFGEKRPIIAIVEPHEAACIYKSALAGDGKPHAVASDLKTIMAGLACGEPNTISWEILRDYADMFFSCPDSVAARGMRILASPIADDPGVISGESGAVGLGLLSILSDNGNLKEAAEKLQIDKDSKILLISTEGDTDPVRYQEIVSDGAYPYVSDAPTGSRAHA
ncbi:MAG: diaminopropionate ammonia-lyase [Peptococcaceae bacterium BICA1-8]|nr:MAG: diaminopropionate ammonia-lyase [Peptococcaceae bacterium BICA1-8]